MRMYHKYITNAYAEYQGHPIQFELMVDPFTKRVGRKMPPFRVA